MSSWLSYGGLGLYGALVTYPSQVLTESSPPQSFTEPLTIAETKAFLKIPDRSPVDPFEDDLLGTLISSARAVAENEADRDLIRRQWDICFDYWPSAYGSGNQQRAIDVVCRGVRPDGLSGLRDDPQAFATNGTDQALYVGTLPGCIRCG